MVRCTMRYRRRAGSSGIGHGRVLRLGAAPQRPGAAGQRQRPAQQLLGQLLESGVDGREEIGELAADAVGGGLEIDRVHPAQPGQQLVGEAFGPGRAGGVGQRPQVLAQPFEHPRQRAGVGGVEQQQLCDGGRAHPVVAAAVGHRALRGAEHRLHQRPVGGGVADDGEGGRQQGGQRQRPLDPLAEVHHVPAQVTDHRFGPEPGQGEHPGENGGLGGAEQGAVVVAVLGERVEGALDVGEHGPRVVGELVAHGPGRLVESGERLGERAEPFRIDGHGAEFRCGGVVVVHDVGTGVLRRDRRSGGRGGERRQQHGQALAARQPGPEAVVLVALADRDEQAGGVLGPLAVAAQPEQVVEHPRRGDDVDGGHGEGGHLLPGRNARRAGGGRGRGGAHPHVLGDDAHRRPRARRRARDDDLAEPTGHGGESDPLGDGEQPDADRRGTEPAGDSGQRRDVRVVGNLLADPPPRLRSHLGEQALAVLRVEAADHHRPGGDRRPQHQPLEPLRQRRHPGRGAAPVCGDWLEQQVLVEQRPAQRRQELRQGRILEDPAAEGVDDGDGAAPHHLHEPDHAEPRVRPQVERVRVGGVDAAQHDVDAGERAERAHPQPALAHHQVGGLDQREPEDARDVGLIEGGLRVRARAEDDHHRVLRAGGRGLAQREPHRLDERRQRPRVRGLVQVGHGACRHPPVGKGVPGAGRGLRVVPHHPEPAVAGTGDVDCVEEQLMRPGEREPVRGPHVAAMAEHQLRGHQSLPERAHRPVQVGEQRVEQP
ncbi:hypothetical protein GQ85_14475 [Rhodococcus rhodochrous]|nr:hypothetical protein GQ85_14475 [Rhodococcus rhodochrous]